MTSSDSSLGVVIAVANTKGGVGKTTLTANVAAYLTHLGYSVLCIDSDPQPTLSGYFPIPDDTLADCGLIELVLQQKGVPPISRGVHFDVVVSDDSEGYLLQWISSRPAGRNVLKKRCAELRREYDFIFIDSQGARSVMLDAALMAADVVLSPIQPTMTAGKEFFRGTLDVVSEINELRDKPLVVNALFVMGDATETRDAAAVKQMVRDGVAGHAVTVEVMESGITKSVRWNEAATAAVPLHDLKMRNDKPFVELQAVVSELLGVDHG